MALISVTEAAKLTGKSIPTIYRHIKAGKVSRTNNKIDTSEIIRVYGEFNNPHNYHEENKIDNHDLSILQKENEVLRSSIAELKCDKEKLFRIIESQQQQLLLSAPIKEPAKSVEIKSATESINQDETLIQRLVRKIFF